MSFLKTTLSQFMEDRCPTLAASLAYYTIFALPPILFLLVMVVTFGMSAMYEQDDAKQRAREVVKTHAAQMIGNAEATEEIERILEQTETQGGVWWKTLLSIAAIIFGATGVVAAIQDSLNYVWEVQPDPEKGGVRTFITKRLASFALILGLGFLLLVSLLATTVLAAIGDRVQELIGMQHFVAAAINYSIQFAVAFIMFAAIFKFMPDVDVFWKDVMVGSLVTSVLFMIGRFGLQFYLSQSSPGEQLGTAAASLAVILVWVYYSAMIFLLGAEFTQVYARRFGRGLHPEAGAVRVVQRIERVAT